LQRLTPCRLQSWADTLPTQKLWNDTMYENRTQVRIYLGDQALEIASDAAASSGQSLSKAIEECVLDNHKIKGADYEARNEITNRSYKNKTR